jgi:hypothetical protein
LANDGDDTVINSITSGDGILDVDDVFVTWRRSLDPSLNWVIRYRDAAGNLVASNAPNTFRGAGKPSNKSFKPDATTVSSTELPFVSFVAGDIKASPGATVSVPIEARVHGPYKLRALMLNLYVQALDDSAPITTPISFESDVLGTPTMTYSHGANNYSAVWLDTTQSGISGTNIIGNLTIAIPAQANQNAAYRIEINRSSSSPNGIGLFPNQVHHGLVTLNIRTNSSWGDKIPDAWRLRFFGTVSNLLSHAEADADGDGVPNWQECLAGTNPTDSSSQLRLISPGVNTNSVVHLRWPSVYNKAYALEWAASLTDTNWFGIATNIPGTDQMVDFPVTNINLQTRFYRVRLNQ